MKKYRLIAAAGLFLLGACSRGTGSMELRNETDSVAYVIGLNAVSYTHLTLPTSDLV